MTDHYKLYYFYGRGRAEFIRYMLQYVGVPYQEIVITTEEWPEIKLKAPMGVLPMLELEDGRLLCQSLAIGRYLATKHGLVSKDDFENALGDQAVGAVEDIYIYHDPICDALFYDASPTEEKTEKAKESLKTHGVIPLFGKFDKLLGDKKWFCGNEVHWADMVIAEYVDRIETVFKNDKVAVQFPKLYAHYQRVHNLHAIKKYVEEKRSKDFPSFVHARACWH